MKKYSVMTRMNVLVEKEVLADDFSDAASKVNQLKFDKLLKAAPGATICDHSIEGIMSITNTEVPYV